MTAQPPDSGRLRVGSYLIVGAAYFATAVLGQSLVLPGTNASPVWPPAGVAVAAVWLLGVRVWPAVFIGSLCGNVIGPLLSGALPSLAVVTNAAVAAVAGTVEAALGGWLLSRWTDTPLRRVRDVLVFVVATPLYCLPSPTIGVTSLVLHGFVEPSLIATAWLTWWLGDVTGAVTFAPMVVAWWLPGPVRNRGEAATMLVCLVVVCGALFYDWLPGESLRSAAYLVFPVLLWSGLRLGSRMTAAGVAVVSLLAVTATAGGTGPFLQDSLNASLLSVQSYLAVIAVALMALSAMLEERQRAQAELRDLNAGLDLTVAARTRELGAEVEVRQQRVREQAALGKVRGAVWNLSRSDEFDDIMPAVRQAIIDAGVPFRTSGVNVVDASTDPPRVMIALFDQSGRLEPKRVEDVDNVALGFWREQQVAYRRDLDSDDPYGERPYIRPPTRCVLDVPFSHGTLAVASPVPNAFDDHLEFLQQLAGVLSEGFRRADDLRLLEERSRHLEREERRQRRILETANEGFWLIDNDQVVLEANSALCTILGRPRQEIVGHRIWDFLDEVNTRIVEEQVKLRSQGAVTAYEVAMSRPDGSLVACLNNGTPLYDDDGTLIGAFGMITDISERVRQQRRERLLARFREAVWRLDSTSRIPDLLGPLRDVIAESGVPIRAFGVNVVESEAEERVRVITTGVDDMRDEMLAPNHARRVVDFWRRGEVVHRADLERHDPLQELASWPGPRRPRSIIDVPFSHGTMAANSGDADAFTEHVELLQDIAGILSEGFRRLDDLQALRDRTERAEEAQRQAETANRSKSVFLANMSHEIRTPMNAILGFTEILSSTLSDARHREYVDSIQSSGKTLLSLINDILDLSKVEAGKLELEFRPADVHALLEDLERLFGQLARDKGIELHVEIDASLPPVLVVDEIRLRQVLVNLVSNGVKFTEAGRVAISAQAESTSASAVTASFSVQDTGPGIPEDQMERIFGAFEQREGQSINEFGGTGLGLAITRQLVELMHGEVSVASTPGEGSTFSVELREVKTADAETLRSAQPEGARAELFRFSPATVLVADDVPSDRELVRGFLARFPFTVLEAENGEVALARVAAQRPDVVLMDIKMPVLDGFTATRRLKADKETATIPVVALTAAVMRESEAEIAQVCDGFLPKPLSNQALIYELARFLSHEIDGDDTAAPVADTGTPAVAEMTAQQRQRLPELLAALEDQRDTWDQLRQTLTINEVEAFATRMQALADGHGYAPIGEWGRRVATQAATFDMDGMASSMAGFEALLVGLREEMVS